MHVESIAQVAGPDPYRPGYEPAIRRTTHAAGAAAPAGWADDSTAPAVDVVEVAPPPDVVAERQLEFRAEDGRIKVTVSDPGTGDVRLELPMGLGVKFPIEPGQILDTAA